MEGQLEKCQHNLQLLGSVGGGHSQGAFNSLDHLQVQLCLMWNFSGCHILLDPVTDHRG